MAQLSSSQDNFLTFVLQMNISTGTVSKKSRFTERMPASSLIFSVTDDSGHQVLLVQVGTVYKVSRFAKIG